MERGLTLIRRIGKTDLNFDIPIAIRDEMIFIHYLYPFQFLSFMLA